MCNEVIGRRVRFQVALSLKNVTNGLNWWYKKSPPPKKKTKRKCSKIIEVRSASLRQDSLMVSGADWQKKPQDTFIYLVKTCKSHNTPLHQRYCQNENLPKETDFVIWPCIYKINYDGLRRLRVPWLARVSAWAKRSSQVISHQSSPRFRRVRRKEFRWRI